MQKDLAEPETLLSTVSMTAARVVNKSAVRIEKFHFRMNLSSFFKIERDNVSDHRARTSDHPFQNHAQVGLRVHRIVIP